MKPQVQAFASYPHAKSIFKPGRNQGFPLMAGSLCSQAARLENSGNFCTFFQESSPSLHILKMRNGSPPGTLGIGLVNNKVLPPFGKHLLLASHSPHKLSGPSGGRAQGHTVVSQAVQAVPNGYAAAGRTIHCAQRARLKQPVDTLIRSFPPPPPFLT